MYGTAEAVKLLLDAGADPLLKNAKGVTAIDFARQAQKEAVVDLIAAAIRGRAQKGSW